MRFAHPVFMGALFVLGVAVAAWGGPARLGDLSGKATPAQTRRHDRPAWLFAALMAFGYGSGLLAVWALMPALLFRTIHFGVGSILLGLLVLVLLNARQATRGRRWALHAHPLLATVMLTLYLVQVLVGVNLLGYAPVPIFGPSERRPAGPLAEVTTAAADALHEPADRLSPSPPAEPRKQPELPDGLKRVPEENVKLRPKYAICPKKCALPGPFWVADI